MTDIDNKHRDASWKDIAAEFKSERDALRGDVLRIQQERDELIAALPTLKAKLAAAESERDTWKTRCMGAVYMLPDSTLCGDLQETAKQEKAKWDELTAQLATAERELAEARQGLAAVESLINQSSGVFGLHLNGDNAYWSELQTGGRFEDWLAPFDAAISGGKEGR